MTLVQAESIRELEGVLHEVASHLSPAHVAALVAHPSAVRAALAVAANALVADESGRIAESIGGVERQSISPGEAARRMSARTRAGSPETLLTSEELAARVGLKTRQSIHDWLKTGRIVGWRGAKRGYVFPAEQLDDRDCPLEGLDRVAEQFDDRYAAWVWLTTAHASLDGDKPLALLAKGEVDRVAEAVEADKQGDFA